MKLKDHIINGSLEWYAMEQQDTIRLYKISCWILLFLTCLFGLKYLSYKMAYREVKKTKSKVEYENSQLKKEIVKGNEYILSVQPKSYKVEYNELVKRNIPKKK